MENNNINIKNIDLWRANKGEKYYFIDYIDNYSYVKEIIYEKYDIRSSKDINRYNSGNYFSSKEIADYVLNSDVWKNRFLDFKKTPKRTKGAYFYIDFNSNSENISADMRLEIDNKRYKEGNYFIKYEELLNFCKYDLEKSQNRIKNLVKKANFTNIKNENIKYISMPKKNDEKEELKSIKIKKEENYTYWRTKRNGIYFKINNYFIIAETDYNIFHNENDYNTGNYFKTFEIGKKVLNSDIWKNRFWDFRKNKKIERSNIYYIIKNDGSIISELDSNFHSVIDYEEGNYFNSQKEAIEFLKKHYSQSIKRIKDFVNNLMKEENYKIKGYNISEISSPYE